MGTIIYTYRADPLIVADLKRKYATTTVCQEMVPIPNGVHVHLNLLVEKTLKKQTSIVVTNFKELGDNQATVSSNAVLILGKGHTLRIESKNVEFNSVEEFDEYFKEFLDLLAPVTVVKGDGKPGPKTKVTPELLDRITKLSEEGLSPRKIYNKLKEIPEIGYVPSYKTIWTHLPDQEDEDLPPPDLPQKKKRKP